MSIGGSQPKGSTAYPSVPYFAFSWKAAKYFGLITSATNSLVLRKFIVFGIKKKNVCKTVWGVKKLQERENFSKWLQNEYFRQKLCAYFRQYRLPQVWLIFLIINQLLKLNS